MRNTLLVPMLAALVHAAPAQEPAATADGSTEALFQQGTKAYNSGQYAQAIDLFSEVLEREPEHLNAYLQRGFCHSLRKEYEAAVADFSAVIQRKPEHLWAYTSRGSAYGKWGRQEQAIQDFDKVLALDPHDQEAYNNRGWARKALGDQAGACKDWRASRKLGNAEAKIILLNNRCK